MSQPRIPRKFKKRLIRLNGRNRILTCLILAKNLYELTGKKQTNIHNLTNVSAEGWVVKQGISKPFKIKT